MVNKIKSVYGLILVLTLICIGFVSADIENYFPTYGTDNTGISSYPMSLTDLSKVSTSNNNYYVSKSIWDHESYQNSEYILWGFEPEIDSDSKVNNVKLYFEWQRDVFITSVGRILVWDESEGAWTEHLLHNPSSGDDELEVIDLSGYINTAEDVNNLKFKFQETDSPYSFRSTRHDLVKLVVNYDLADETAPTCTIDELYNKNTFEYLELSLDTYLSNVGDFYVYGSSSDDESGIYNVQYNRTSPNAYYFTFANADPKDGGFSSLSEAWQSDPSDKEFILGQHRICCRVEDNAHNLAVGECKNICIDNSEPTMVTIEDNTEDCDDSLNYWGFDSIVWDLTAEDEGCAGVGSYKIELYKDGVLYSVWEGYSSNSLTTSTLADGKYYIRVKPFDKSGNAGEWMSSSEIIVDTTKPEVSIDSPEEGKWFKEDFNVTESDSDSNILSCEYKIDNGDSEGDWSSIECNSLLTVDVSEDCPVDGACIVSKKVKDKACNVAETSRTFNVDRVAPIVSKTVGNPKVKPTLGKWFDILTNGWFITDETEIEITCLDSIPGSGVDEIYYQINGGEILSSPNPFTLSADGLYNITYYCTDKVGHSSDYGFEVDKVDTEAPVTTRTVFPFYVSNSKKWISCESKETFNCSDTEVGCNETENYKRCNDLVDFACASGENIQCDRRCDSYEYFWKSTDLLGNNEDWKSEVNWMDCEGPGIHIWNPSTEETITERCSMDVVVEVWDNKVGLDKSTVRGELRNESGVVRTVSLFQNNNLTGIFFGGVFFSGFMDLEGLSSGQYELVIYSEDYLGNPTMESKLITLEDGVYVEYLSPASCDVDPGKGGKCFFTLHACVRDSDEITMHMDKVNGGVVDPFTLNATISKGNQSAKVGLMNLTTEISNAEPLRLRECENINGMETFNLELAFSSEISSKIGSGPYTLNYKINSYDNECEVIVPARE